MPLVGDVILACREQFPDIPQTQQAPSIIRATPGLGGNLAAGNYFLQATTLNPWGETTPSKEYGPFVVPDNGILNILVGQNVGAQGCRVYVSPGAGGNEIYYGTISSGSNLILGQTPLISGQPPSYNTAFLPDSDGASVGAYTMYRWLNDALQEMGRIAGGILDMTGFQASTVQADYVIPSSPAPWIRFTDAWFDGYFCQDFKRRNQWRRQFISAISFYWSVEQVNRQMILNFYPVPNRNGAVGDLVADIGATDSVIPLGNIPDGMMFPGMCQIDSEIIIYSQSDTNGNLLGCIRGMGGTTATAHFNEATVTEFNIVLAGFRQPITYSVGQAAQELMIPTGWEVGINLFLLSRYRNYEQNRQEGSDYYKMFIEEARRIAFDTRQFPASATIGGPASFLTLYPGGPFGVIVP